MAKVLIGNFKGPKGDQGVKGDPGTAASIQVGTTQTVQPEENAEVTNTGTTSAAVLNFKIPRGKDGMTDLTAEYTDASEYTCQPTVNAPAVVKELDGKTEQVETTGAQLINPSETRSNSYSGLSMENLGDGEFKFSGANIAETGIIFHIEISQTLIPGTSYYLSVNNNKAVNDVSIRIYNNGTIVSDIIPELNEINKSVLFTIPDGSTGNRLTVRFAQSGTTEGGFTIKPMLSIGSAALPWEPYTGGSPAPSPDYPQVIKGVGGMGYFDGEWRQGSYDISGVPDTSGAWISFVNKIPCKANDNIKVSYDKDIAGIRIFFWNTSGGFLSSEPINGKETIGWTAPATAGSFVISFNDNNISPALAAYCTVTINGKYQTGVEVTGANLLNIDTFVQGMVNTTTGNIDSIQAFITSDFIPVDSGEYTLSMNATGYLNYAAAYDANKNILPSEQLNFVSNSGKVTIPENVKYIRIRLISPTYPDGEITVEQAKILDVMFNKGSTALPYQPYHHTTFTIPLTAPLYDGDKICYVKPGESYIDENGDTVVADKMLYGVYRENAVIKSYNSEEIPGEYKSSAGELTTGAEVVYKLAQPWFEPFTDQSIFYGLRTDDTLSYVYSSDPIEPILTVEVAKNQTGGYLLESYAQAQKNALSEADNASRLASVEQQLLTLNTTVSTMGGGGE